LSLSAAVLTISDRQRNCSVAAAAMNGSGPPRCMAWTTPTCSWVVRAIFCGRGGRHLSLLTSVAWRTGHWSRTDGLTIARISCCCGS